MEITATLPWPDRTPAEDVRYQGNSGKHLLLASISHFDPEPTNWNVRCQVRGEEGSVPAPDRFSRKRILFHVGTNTDRRLGVSWPVSPGFREGSGSVLVRP